MRALGIEQLSMKGISPVKAIRARAISFCGESQAQIML